MPASAAAMPRTIAKIRTVRNRSRPRVDTSASMPRRGLRTAHQPTGKRAGQYAISIHDVAVHDRRRVAFCALNQPASATGKIARDLGRMQQQTVEVNDVEIGFA